MSLDSSMSESVAYPKDCGVLPRIQWLLRRHSKPVVLAAIGLLGFVAILSPDAFRDDSSGLGGTLRGKIMSSRSLGSTATYGGSVHAGYFSVKSSKIGDNRFRFAAVTDLDELSRVKGERKPTYRSILVPGTITYDKKANRYAMEAEAARTLTTKHNEAGRGAEFSELTVFEGRLLTFDDRTGDVFEIMNKKDGADSFAAPRYIVTEGDGDTDKGMKWEWSTTKNGLLYMGSFGKEYTNADGSVANSNNLWITVMNSRGEFRRIDWSEQYTFVRNALGCQHPGYVIHEAVNWSPHMRKWVFMPRRISTEAYNDVLDEKRGSNKVVIVDEKFTKADIVEVSMASKDGLHGFSSFAFVPGTKDRHAIALRSVEEDCAGDDLDVCKQRSYIVIFDVTTGEVLMDEVKLEQDMKFEGIEFVDMHVKP